MSDPALIADLIRAGVDPDLIGRVSNAVTTAFAEGASSVEIRRNSAEIHTDSAAERRREKDRERYHSRKKSAENHRNPQKSAEIPNPPLTIEGSIDSPKKEKNKKESKRRGSRLPAEWKPSQADTEYALAKGTPQARIDAEEEKFRDYWLARPGPEAEKLDWAATWRTWIGRSLERNPVPRNGPQEGAHRGERGVDWW